MTSLERRIQQEQERLKGLKAQLSKQQRRDETRRKVIYGAATQKLLQDFAGEKGAKLQRLLDNRVTRPSDRTFLDLAPLKDSVEGDAAAAGEQP